MLFSARTCWLTDPHPSSRFISRFNEDGKKAKSKGNHVWNIEAKKIPSGGWVFREFTRKIAGPPPKVAYIGLKYQWAPRVWDPQMRCTHWCWTLSVGYRCAWIWLGRVMIFFIFIVLMQLPRLSSTHPTCLTGSDGRAMCWLEPQVSMPRIVRSRPSPIIIMETRECVGIVWDVGTTHMARVLHLSFFDEGFDFSY